MTNADLIARPAEEPKPRACPHCDFSCGQRGMDRCHVCDGTGSVFLAGGRYHPNTEKGFNAAVRALEDQR
jgi:ribosomal protein L37AE/L43A